MKVKKYAYVSIDCDRQVHVEAFNTMEDALKAAKEDFDATVACGMGKDFTFPDGCVSENGDIDFHDEYDTEISFTSYGWSFAARGYTTSGTIEELDVDITSTDAAACAAKEELFPEWPFEKIVTLSSSHIPEDIYHGLAEDAAGMQYTSIPYPSFVYDDGYFGSIVIHCMHDMEHDYVAEKYPELYKVVDWALKRGAEYIRFDEDGEVVDLPVYEEGEQQKPQYFIRAVGSFKTGDSELMTHKQAEQELEKRYWECLREFSDSSKPLPDEYNFDLERGEFTITASEASQFQTMYILEKNLKEGAEYFIEELRRESNRADDLAMLYEYESRDMGVYECTSRIRELAKHLQQLLPKKA